MCHRLPCFGDSNTYGYDPRSYLGGRYPENVRWTASLNAGGWDVINEGENGRSVPRSAWEMEAAIQTFHRANADALIVMLGSNDLLQSPNITAEICGERMERFLSNILAKVRAALKTLLVAPPPMKPGAWVSDSRTIAESCRLAKCYETVAHRLDVIYADAGTWAVRLAYDGVHFSEESYVQ